jgi:hypothetical protein
MRPDRASDKREMTHNDHTGKELGEAGGIQETVDTLQNSETLEAANFVDGTGEDILNLGEDWVQSFHSTPDGAEVG